jgi:hypothetical protein
LDIQPRNDILSITIREDRNGAHHEIETTKPKIKEVYEKIK